MPRPKGSKNKKTTVVIETVENIDERIAATESAISTLTGELKAKKAELKELTKAKAAAEKLAAEKKAEEERLEKHRAEMEEISEKYTVSAIGTDVKNVTSQLIKSISSGITSGTVGFDVKA